MGLRLLTAVALIGATAACGAMGTAVATERVPIGVPTQFHGDWRVSLSECPPAITDRPVSVNATRIRLDHSVGEVRVVEENDRRNITIAGELLSDADPWDAKLRLMLSDSGSELTISEGDWSVKLKRCPKV
jgi:hypothetical protein